MFHNEVKRTHTTLLNCEILLGKKGFKLFEINEFHL